MVETKKLARQKTRNSRISGDKPVNRKRNSTNYWNQGVNEIKSRRSLRRSVLEEGENYPIYTRHSIVDAPKLKELLMEQAKSAETKRLTRTESVVINGFVMNRKPSELLRAQSSLTQVDDDGEKEDCGNGHLKNGFFPEIKVTDLDSSEVILEKKESSEEPPTETSNGKVEENCTLEMSQVAKKADVNNTDLDTSEMIEETNGCDTEALSQTAIPDGSSEKSANLWVETEDFEETCSTGDSKEYCPIRASSEDLGRKTRRSKSLFKFNKNGKTNRSKSCSSAIKTEKRTKKKTKN